MMTGRRHRHGEVFPDADNVADPRPHRLARAGKINLVVPQRVDRRQTEGGILPGQLQPACHAVAIKLKLFRLNLEPSTGGEQ